MPKISLAATILVLAATAAHAAPITYSLTGIINQVGTNVLIPVTVGQQIPISITVDSAYPGGPTYSYLGSGLTNLITSATFDNFNNNGLFQTITITPGASIDFNTTGPQISFGFDLALTGAQNGALASGALPANLSAANFTGGTFSVTEAFSPLSYGYSGTISGLAVAVPEPASWLVLGIGLIGGLLMVRRANRRA